MSLPLTPETRHFLGRREFEVMKPGAYLVNVGRGGIIDQHALIEALKAGRLVGAGLDVTDPEPLNADSALWDMENVILTRTAPAPGRLLQTWDASCSRKTCAASERAGID